MENHVYSMELNREYPRIESGKGIYMYKTDGTEIIDGAGGPVAVGLGHGIKEISDAIAEQAQKIAYVHRDDCITPVLEESCRRIYEFSDGDLYKTFQVCSGSEATEIAIKMITKYNIARGKKDKFKILGRWQSYHGITSAALSISGFGSRKKGYEHYGFDHGHIAPCYCYRCWFGDKPETCSLQCAKALENEILAQGPDSVAAFFAEPVSGMSLCAAVPHPDYFKEIRRICDKYDVLLVFDEVMTGFGRTGETFAYKHFDIVTDMITIGKSMSGGYFPLAGVSMTKKIFDVFKEHDVYFPAGYTWSGSPLGAAVHIAVDKYMIKHDCVRKSEIMGHYLKAQMQRIAKKHPTMDDVRGLGLMVGAEFVKDSRTKESFDISEGFAGQIQNACLERNMIIEASQGCNRGSMGDAIVISPAFVVTKEQIDEIIMRLDDAITEVERKYGYEV